MCMTYITWSSMFFDESETGMLRKFEIDEK